MIKKLTSYLDYGMFAEIALAIFATVFVAIVIRTLFLKRYITDQNARIALRDSEEIHEY